MSKLEDMILAEIGEKALTDPNLNSDLEHKEIFYDPKGMPNSQRAYNQAAMENLEVVLPADNELQIDIDNEHSYLLFQKQLQILQVYVGVVDVRESSSKSGKDWKLHITVELDPDVTMIERLALQAMMGSDRVRELLGYVQYKNNDPHPVLFLEKKEVPALPPAETEILLDTDIPY